MADVIDVANEHAEYLLQVALERRARGSINSVSAEECEVCDDPIPELRRLAIPGCVTCIICQAIRERRQ